MAMPAHILAIGIDPAQHSGVALVRLDMATGEAELVGVWALYGESWRVWGKRALSAAYEVVRLASDLPVVGWYERPAPARPGDQNWNPCPMAERAGALLMALQVAGVQATIQPVTTSQWTAGARVPCGKSGDGAHRIEEAAARVEFAGAELEALDHCRVDCAEAMLIALACARAEAERRSGGQQLPLAASNSTSTMRPLTGRRASPAAALSGVALFSGENNMNEIKEIPAPAGDPRWYAAGWFQRGIRIIIVIQEGREVLRRERRDGSATSAVAGQIAAAKAAARLAGAGAEVCLHDKVACDLLTGESESASPTTAAALAASAPSVRYTLISSDENPARAAAFEAGRLALRAP